MRLVTEKFIIDDGLRMSLADAKGAVMTITRAVHDTPEGTRIDWPINQENASTLLSYFQRKGVVEWINGPDSFYWLVRNDLHLGVAIQLILNEPAS